MITAYHVNEKDFFSIIGNSFVNNLQKRRPKMLSAIKYGCLIISLLILVIYALLIYLLDNWSKMGIVISISITCMDIFNYILYQSKMVKNTASLVVLLIINRVAMVILGQNYWVYGFMGLYMLYAVAMLFLVAKVTFPLKNQIVIRRSMSLKKLKTRKEME